RGGDAVRRLHEFHSRAIGDDVLIDVADAGVDDPSLDDDRTAAEREPQVVQRVEVHGESGFHRGAAAADLLDQHRLEHHDFALEFTEDGDALGVALVRLHAGRTITG